MRNYVRALEKFDEFIELCRKFIKKPGIKYFREKKIDQKKYNLVFKVLPLKGSKDIIGTKMLKVFEKICRELNENEFIVKESAWEWKEEAHFYFKVQKTRLDKEKKHYGPPVKFKEDAEKFMDKHKNFKIKEEKGRLCVMLPRRFIKLKDFIINLSNDEEIKKRIAYLEVIKI